MQIAITYYKWWIVIMWNEFVHIPFRMILHMKKRIWYFLLTD